jgi:hypothetical protein
MVLGIQKYVNMLEIKSFFCHLTVFGLMGLFPYFRDVALLIGAHSQNELCPLRGIGFYCRGERAPGCAYR